MSAATLDDGDGPLWDAFASSRIWLEDGTELAGPRAIAALPWPSPVYVITAWNPGGRLAPAQVNDLAHATLGRELESRAGWTKVIATGGKDDHAEVGYAVVGATRPEACDVGRRHAQLAVFELTDAEVRIVGCASERARSTRARVWPA